MKSASVVLVSFAFATLLLAGALPAGASSSTPVSLAVQGQITNSGIQVYSASGGAGSLVYALVDGQVANPETSQLTYNVLATVVGAEVFGSAQITLTLQVGAATETLYGTVDLNGMIPAETFPLGCGSGTSCSSAIPGFFQGNGAFSFSNQGGSSRGGRSWGRSGQSLPFTIESSFLNPFGGPLVFTSDDGTSTTPPSIFIVATYSHSSVYYFGVQTGGSLSGTEGGSQSVTGSFHMVTSASENLVAGTEQESGTISFTDVSPSSLDLSGTFQGTSTIPTAPPGSDCSALTGFPGTCSLTGFASTGTFSLGHGYSGVQLSGAYSIVWDTPAVSFCSPSVYILSEGGPCTITATLTSGHR